MLKRGRSAGVVGIFVVAVLTGCGDSEQAPAKNACRGATSTATSLAAGERQILRDGWAIRSSADVALASEKLSSPCATPEGWTATSVPSTVVRAQVDAGLFPDPFMGKNLRDLPGMSYILGFDFGNFPTPEDSPYKPSWWYRTDFELAKATEGRTRTWLHFDGINYRANIWLNGKLVAPETEVVGMYRRFAFDVTDVAEPGRHNVLALEVFGPDAADLAHSFMDHAPMPPDKSMGLWRDVFVKATGPVAIEHEAVVSDLALPGKDSAKLSVLADLVNSSDHEVSGTLTGSIGPIQISEPVSLAAHETRSIALEPTTHPELLLASPKLWWPFQLGAQNLYDFSLDFSSNDQVSDHAAGKFGVRKIESQMLDGEWVKFSVNGQSLLVRGAGYEHDLFFRWDELRDETDLHLVKDMGLNTVRLEGGLGSDHLFDVADREGVLIIAGWQCCNAWEKWGKWTDASLPVAKASLETQMYRLRGHPSLLTWWNGSDHLPPPDVEQTYLDVISAAHWPNPKQSSAGNDVSTLTGPSGVKMNGPYDYTPPIYWYVDKDYGGAWGFNGETGPGPAIPSVESLKKFLPAADLWPIGEAWQYHAGGVPFDNVTAFSAAMQGRYGEASGLDEYVIRGNALEYDGERAMFEAYRKNKSKATGVVQWMLNNAWPSVIWHLCDYYFAVGGGYYGTKKANERFHIQYSYDDASVVVVNDTHQRATGMKVSIQVYDFALVEKFSKEATLDVAEDSANVVATLPNLSGITTTYFVKLTLRDATSKLVSENFYWLSTKADVLDFANTKFALTPTTDHADLTLLATLPKVTPVLGATLEDAGDRTLVHVTLENTGASLVFLAQLRLTQGAGGPEALPSTWTDNFVSLMPGEKRELTAEVPKSALGGAKPVVAVTGWNVPETTVAP